jgi:hypothetical protein
MLDIIIMPRVCQINGANPQIRYEGIVYYVIIKLLLIADPQSESRSNAIVELGYGLGRGIERIGFLLRGSGERCSVDLDGGFVEAVGRCDDG